MAYIDGYVLPVPEANKDAYCALAKKTTAMLREFGATRVVEAWGHDVPRGEVTDFYKAAQATDGETIVISWVMWPSKDVRDAGWERMMSDERMQDGEMPFDARRMFWGGFEPIVDEGQG